MAENLMNSSHKATNQKYRNRDEYERIFNLRAAFWDDFNESDFVKKMAEDRDEEIFKYLKCE